MTATSHDDGEPVTSVVAEPDFLVRSSEDFNFNIRKFDLGYFVHWRIDDEELGRDRPLVFGARKKDAVAWDAKFGGELVAEAIRFPVREGDFGDGEPTSVVKVDGVAISSTRKSVTRALMRPPMPWCSVAYPCKPMACAMGSDMETTFVFRDWRLQTRRRRHR